MKFLFLTSLIDKHRYLGTKSVKMPLLINVFKRLLLWASEHKFLIRCNLLIVSHHWTIMMVIFFKICYSITLHVMSSSILQKQAVQKSSKICLATLYFDLHRYSRSTYLISKAWIIFWDVNRYMIGERAKSLQKHIFRRCNDGRRGNKNNHQVCRASLQHDLCLAKERMGERESRWAWIMRQ